MDKQLIIRLLKENRRGVYAIIIRTYADIVTSMSSKMAMQIIKEDLEKVSVETVNLNYFTFAHAAAKFKKDHSLKPENEKPKWDFKDAYETKSSQLLPGEFKIGK